MTSKIHLVPYANKSRTIYQIAKSLKKLGVPYVRHRSPRDLLKIQEGDLVFNYGLGINEEAYDRHNLHFLNTFGSSCFNVPSAIREVSNKLTFFRVFSNPVRNLLVDHTEDYVEVEEALRQGHGPWFARTKLTGHSGEGIVILREQRDITDEIRTKCKLFTKNFHKTHEYRVYVMGEEIFHASSKHKSSRVGFHDEHVWTHNNGYVYCFKKVKLPAPVEELVREFIQMTLLKFFAIDILYNKNTREAKIVEVNTAPGMEGTTLERFIDKLKAAYERIVTSNEHSV